MAIIKINQERIDLSIVEDAAKTLKQEKLIIHPTETVYGLAAIYSSESAIDECIKLKGKTQNMPLSIMVQNIDSMLEISGVNVTGMRYFLETVFPGAITVILPRMKELNMSYWDKFDSIGFRFPKHKLSNLLLEKVSIPLITTSVNLSGESPAVLVDEIPEKIRNAVPLILDGGSTLEQVASTVVKIDIYERTIKLLRPGAASFDKIKKAFDLSINLA